MPDSETLRAIKDNNLIFISAQPDEVYFHWQVELYLYQFSKHGILDQCYAVFGHKGDSPSEYGLWLSKKYVGRIHFYKDERTPEQRNYIPSIRPHILKKFFSQKPKLGKNLFYHDSDIFLVKLPPFEKMLVNNDKSIGYVSDTISYIGANYIIECCKRYKSAYPQLPDDDLFNKMCEICNVSKELVIKNQMHSGGAQYLLKNIGAKFWEDVETSSNKMWKLFKNYESNYPIKDHLQFWTTDMWAVLWTYWNRKKQTVVDKSLDFSWGVSTVLDYNRLNIFHLAGVTANMKDKHFYKGEYSGKNVFTEYRKNNNIFSHINTNSATFEYVKVIKEYVGETNDKVFKTPTHERFEMQTESRWAGIYRKVPKKFGGKNLWRSSDNNYLIFRGKNGWILTEKKYESEIKENSGGYAFNSAEEPYLVGWNINCTLIKL